MSLAIKYETVADATMRLRHTVVLYNGDPVYIKEVREGEGDDIHRVLFDPVPIVKVKTAEEAVAVATNRKYISSKKFDIAPFRMGYVNDPNGVFYCTRMPNRVQKQGLCGENFSAKDNYGGPVGFARAVACKEFPAMVRGDYPSFAVALRSLGKVSAVAFDYDFCLVKDEILDELVHIYHKGIKVGASLSGRVTLGAKYKCLKESLEELGVKV